LYPRNLNILNYSPRIKNFHIIYKFILFYGSVLDYGLENDYKVGFESGLKEPDFLYKLFLEKLPNLLYNFINHILHIGGLLKWENLLYVRLTPV